MSELITLAEVILVDLIFAGDNAIAVGLVAASLPIEQRKKVIATGVAIAVVFRIVFAVATVQLLKIPGLLIVGGLLLLWVCWRLFSDLRKRIHAEETEDVNKEKKYLTFQTSNVSNYCGLMFQCHSITYWPLPELHGNILLFWFSDCFCRLY